MTTLYLISGIPGSGKTTLAKELAERHQAKIHSYDDIPNARGNLDEDGSIKKQWIEAMNADLSAGNRVVCDSTNLAVDARKWIINRLIPCKKVLLFKVVPLEICLERNKGRAYELPEWQIRMAAKSIEPPSADEGWDSIYVYRV